MVPTNNDDQRSFVSNEEANRNIQIHKLMQDAKNTIIKNDVGIEAFDKLMTDLDEHVESKLDRTLLPPPVNEQ